MHLGCSQPQPAEQGAADSRASTLQYYQVVALLSTEICNTLVAGAWSERKKMFHGGSFLKLADDDV